ncbi:MAG: phosphoglycerate dehydrogenase [Salinisphaeraceae bacterium]
MYRIQTLNNISPLGLDRFPRNLYEVASELSRPDAIMVRSADMHGLDLDDTIKAIGRAGAGVNNIPVDRMSERGVPVFNAPGANANAVKELVLAGLFLAARNIVQAWDYVQKLDDSEPGLKKKVEAGKKQFKGVELPGRTIGVVGLGAIGVKVANTARDLGMNVLGYDPGITVSNAWRLHAGVEQALSVDELLSRSDFVSIHVPLVDGTEGLIDAKRLRLMRQQAVLLNFSRAEIVDEAAVLEALDADKLSTYVCDFPTMASKNHPKVVSLPHLGASTDEAEDNCAVMVADQIRDYLEVGNVRNSVNFPETIMPPTDGAHRICIVNANVPNMVGQISSTLARHELNIADLINKSRNQIAYTLVDVDTEADEAVLEEIRGIEGVLSVRYLNAVSERSS